MQSYKDINNSFYTISPVADFPPHNYWKGNPLSRNVFIDSRVAGYKPYRQMMVIREEEPFGNKCSVYQRSCDLITPVNSCYLATRQIVGQP